MSRSGFVIAAMVGAGCRIGTVSPEEFDRAYPVGRLTTLASPGLDDSVAALRESVGGRVRITGITFSEQRTFITAQNPRAPSEFDNYNYWNGSASKDPVRVDADDEKRYLAELFDLDKVPLTKLADLARKALKELPIDGAHVQSVGVDLDDGALVIEVRVESKRRNGYVRFDSTGALIQAKQD